MKRRFAWIAIALIAIATLIMNLRSKDGFLNSNSMGNPLLGNWVLQRDQSSAEFSIYELEFVDSHTLICNISDNGQKSYNILFRYDYVGENRIRITAPRRLSSEWEIINEGGQLSINSSPWPGGVGVFRKSMTINWASVALLLSICVVGAFLVPIPRARIEDRKPSAEQRSQNQFIGLSKYIVHNVIAVIFFLGGVMGGLVIWSLPPLLQVRLPWDAVITIELGAILFIFGMRIVMANNRAFMESTVAWNYLFGVFLIGAAVLGIIIGLIRLFIFIETGFYP